MPPANANTLRLLVQTCAYMNEQAAINEMDSQALAEVRAAAAACGLMHGLCAALGILGCSALELVQHVQHAEAKLCVGQAMHQL
jgi:hypothetical protein